MKRRLLRLTMALMLIVGSYGVFATKTVNAQCGCTCSADCARTCYVSCTQCGLFEWIPIAARCCEGVHEAQREACSETPPDS